MAGTRSIARNEFEHYTRVPEYADELTAGHIFVVDTGRLADPQRYFLLHARKRQQGFIPGSGA